MFQSTQDRPTSKASFVVEVPDFQRDPNERVVHMVLLREERKELAKLHKVDHKATIER